MRHLDLLHSWGHSKLANHLAIGGQPEDFDENAPEVEHPPALLALRDELKDLQLNIGDSKQDVRPLFHAHGNKRHGNYSVGAEFPVGEESRAHVGFGGERGDRPRELKVGFQTPIAGGHFRASGSFHPEGKSVQMGYERRFEDGGYAEPLAAPDYQVDDDEAEFHRRMAKALSEQVGSEVRHIGTLKGAKDFALNHIAAPAIGGTSDIVNMGLEGVDYMRGEAAKQNKRGKPHAVTPLASDKPFMGSEQIRDKLSDYGVTSSEDKTPILGMIGDVFTNPVGPLSAVKGVKAAHNLRTRLRHP